jgi:hypothetical protein
MQRLWQAEIHPCPDDGRHDRHEDEDQVPVAEQHDDLPGARRHDGHDHEHHHDQRHDFRHRTPAENVADDRDGDDAHGGRADALDEAHRQQGGEARHENRGQRRHDVDAEPDKHGNAPAEPVGDRAVEQLRESKADQVGRDDILPVVLVLDAEARADLLEAGQHDVDGERVERHQERHERNEFYLAHAFEALGRFGGKSRHIN